jgi:hypothetical protein
MPYTSDASDASESRTARESTGRGSKIPLVVPSSEPQELFGSLLWLNTVTYHVSHPPTTFLELTEILTGLAVKVKSINMHIVWHILCSHIELLYVCSIASNFY